MADEVKYAVICVLGLFSLMAATIAYETKQHSDCAKAYANSDRQVEEILKICKGR